MSTFEPKRISLAEFRTEAVKVPVLDQAMQKMGGSNKKFTYVQWMFAHAAACRIDPGLVPHFSLQERSADNPADMYSAPGVYYTRGEETHEQRFKSKDSIIRKGQTCSVVAGYTLSGGDTVLESLAVTDGANNPWANPPVDEIAKAMKRCYVKALALGGLWATVFTGEDTLPGTDQKRGLPSAPSAAKAGQENRPPKGQEDLCQELSECKTLNELQERYNKLPPAQRAAVKDWCKEHSRGLS